MDWTFFPSGLSLGERQGGEEGREGSKERRKEGRKDRRKYRSEQASFSEASQEGGKGRQEPDGPPMYVWGQGESGPSESHSNPEVA